MTTKVSKCCKAKYKQVTDQLPLKRYECDSCHLWCSLIDQPEEKNCAKDEQDDFISRMESIKDPDTKFRILYTNLDRLFNRVEALELKGKSDEKKSGGEVKAQVVSKDEAGISELCNGIRFVDLWKYDQLQKENELLKEKIKLLECRMPPTKFEWDSLRAELKKGAL